jgi:hypothetical protein
MKQANAGKQAAPVFQDWAGQSVAYRLRPTRDDEERDAHERVTCEINPHGDAWHAMGRGRSDKIALEEAIKAWNEYDSH